MRMIDEGTPNPSGEVLVEELRWVHGIIRENLAVIQALTEQVLGGTPAAELQAQLKDLSASSIVWTLRAGCVRYCALVHAHHHGEDTHFFPGLRRANPALCPVVDKLEADHLAISEHLDAVDAAARRLRGDDDAARADLAAALHTLAAHLLTHLDYEEANLNPTLRRLSGWPFG